MSTAFWGTNHAFFIQGLALKAHSHDIHMIGGNQERPHEEG